MIHFQDQSALNKLVSDQFSDWSQAVLVDQALINQFADLSGDDFWIHTDSTRCQEVGMQSTIAQGFLLLVLLSKMRTGVDLAATLTGYSQIMNYGSNKLRFLAPVAEGSQVHARSRVADISVDEKKTKVTMEWQINVVGQSNPSLLYHMAFVFL